MMSVHDLKCWPRPFYEIWCGRKTFEFRKDDRNYQRGDRLILREWNASDYLGPVIEAEAGFILHGPDFGVPEGYAVISLLNIVREAPRKEGR